MESTVADPWEHLPAAEAVDMAALLEQRAACSDQIQVNAALIEIADPQPGQHWLDLGCGNRALTRLLAECVQPNGSVAGLDLSPAMLTSAHRAGQLDAAATAYALPFSGDVFDGALAARLLLHLQHAQAALTELTRVVRPGGYVALMDWDFDTLVLDHSNRDLTRRILHWRCDNHGGDNWSGRQLYRRLKTAGLVAVRVQAVPSVVTERATSLAQTVLHCAHRALEGGGIPLESYISWSEELERRLRAGAFFASIVYFVGVGRVP